MFCTKKIDAGYKLLTRATPIYEEGAGYDVTAEILTQTTKHACQYGRVASLSVLTASHNIKPNTDGTQFSVQCSAVQRSAL
jgi:hypothetical protein